MAPETGRNLGKKRARTSSRGTRLGGDTSDDKQPGPPALAPVSAEKLPVQIIYSFTVRDAAVPAADNLLSAASVCSKRRRLDQSAWSSGPCRQLLKHGPPDLQAPFSFVSVRSRPSDQSLVSGRHRYKHHAAADSGGRRISTITNRSPRRRATSSSSLNCTELILPAVFRPLQQVDRPKSRLPVCSRRR